MFAGRSPSSAGVKSAGCELLCSAPRLRSMGQYAMLVTLILSVLSGSEQYFYILTLNLCGGGGRQSPLTSPLHEAVTRE